MKVRFCIVALLIFFTQPAQSMDSSYLSPKLQKTATVPFFLYFKWLPYEITHYIIILMLEDSLKYNFQFTAWLHEPTKAETEESWAKEETEASFSPDGQTIITYLPMWGIIEGKARQVERSNNSILEEVTTLVLLTVPV